MKEDVAGWMVNALKTTKSDYFEREQFIRTKKQMDSFVRQTAEEIKRLDQAEWIVTSSTTPWTDKWEEALDKHFPQYTHECHGFGTCSFLALCQVGQAALPLFKQRVRD